MDCREVAVSGGSTAMPKTVKTLNNIHTTMQEWTNNVFPNTKKPHIEFKVQRPCQWGGTMSPVWILKLLVLVFINACCLLLALPSLSQFGQGRLFLVAISFYVPPLLFRPCRLSEFTLAGPLYRYYFSTVNHHNFISLTPAQIWFKHKDCTRKHSASNIIFVLIKTCFSWWKVT